MDVLWGPETDKAIENFPVSGRPMPERVIRWLARIKAAAAIANAELGELDPDVADRIARAATDVAEGEHLDQFPVDVFQTGSGTSTNMNANEVIATLAGPDVHPNDHVNRGQSSNDVVPSAVHLAALDVAAHDVAPALDRLADTLGRRAADFADVAKAARTHLMDAVPITLGDEFGGYESQIRLGAARVRDTFDRVGRIPLGGTAVGNGLNAHPELAARVRARLVDESSLPIGEPADRFEAQAARDALVELSGAVQVVAVSLTKIANDLVLMASGPRCGFGEIELPELQKGSSIMPGKVNPVVPEVVLQVAAQVIGNHTAVTVAGTQGNFELNVRVPVIARNLLDSLTLTASACDLFAQRCIAGLTANVDRLAWTATHTLASATALNPHVGYDSTTAVVRDAVARGDSLADAARRAGIPASTVELALDADRLARGNRD